MLMFGDRRLRDPARQPTQSIGGLRRGRSRGIALREKAFRRIVEGTRLRRDRRSYAVRIRTDDPHQPSMRQAIDRTLQ